MNAGAFGWPLNANPATTNPGTLNPNPNILMIMVDQLRLPYLWLNSGQQTTFDTLCPNITWLRQNSYHFLNFFAAAQACTPSRATLLTGLYAPQTGVFQTSGPPLNSGFPTFGTALQDIAGYAADNIMWFGKWHLSNLLGGANGGTDSLPNYGFNSSRSSQILWPSYYGSANGSANEGNNGYLYQPPANPVGTDPIGACDVSIANDFINNWTNHQPTTPWFACVSFVNPHDMHFYPGFFPATTSNTFGNDNPGPQGVPGDSPGKPVAGVDDFQPSQSNFQIAPLFTTWPPTGFNWEDTLTLQDKSWDVTATVHDKNNFLQYQYQLNITDTTANLSANPTPLHAPVLPESQYSDFLNWYYYMIYLVDQNIGAVLTKVLGSGFISGGNPSTNTAIIFLSDHGDHGGSHGLHAKAGAVYDEALRVPLYVVLPGQSGTTNMYQMCSMVDVFKLVVELALGNSNYNWQGDSKYKDQALNYNQSLLNFIYTAINNPQHPNAAETRGFLDSSNVWWPYILTTVDETFWDATNWNGGKFPDCALRNHVICMRTKSDSSIANFENAYSGAKLAIYSKWVWDPTIYGLSNPYAAPLADGTGAFVQDYEYYDYANYQNRGEVSYTPSGGSPSGSDYPPALAAQDWHGIAGSGTGANALLQKMALHFGNLQILTSANPVTITPASGTVAAVLDRPLSGTSNGTPLANYTAAGITAWYNWLHSHMTCSS